MSNTTYTVDYIVNVINGEALSQLNAMRIMMNKLGKSVQVLDRLNSRITKLNNTLNNKSWKVNLNTTEAERKLTNLEAHLDRIRTKANGIGVNMTGGSGTRGGNRTTTTNSSSQNMMPIVRGSGSSTTSARSASSHGGIIPYYGASNRHYGSSYPVAPNGYPLQSYYPPYRSNGRYASSRFRYNRRQISGGNRLQNTRGIPHQYWWRHVGSGNTVIDVPYQDVTNQMSRGLVSRSAGSGRVPTAYPLTPYSRGTTPPSGSNRGRGGRDRGKRGGKGRGPSPKNLTYKLFGPTPLTNNGGMAIDMLKGMGIAYGIAGLGALAGNIVSEATEYDNTMQTVENILKAHDKSTNFDAKFNSMSQTIRQVGLQTKFKATEVADAAKFLAMAGLNVTDINNDIKPISNIALIGDTDLGETADLVTNVMTGYGMKSHQLRKAADIMTNTFTMANVTLPEIAESYKYAASPLQAAGVQFEEATAALGILGNAGMKGSQAGTTMRTILNNIINPRGKYRKEAWSNTGIEIFNEHGQLKELHTIFKELLNLDMPVDAFYKLFDKTAVQGAIALTQNVDRWNEIIDENFLSQGIADDLAEKKKNTIQGLWYQLTSAITNDGINSFAGIHSQIKSLLQSITTWVLSDNGQSAFTGVFNSLMEFVDIIKDVTQYFYGFYQTFGWAIKGMIKWQLYLWPIIKLITTLKTTFLALVGIGRVVASIHAITKAFIGLRGAVGGWAALGIAARNSRAYMLTGGAAPLLPWLSGNVLATDASGNTAHGTTVGTGKAGGARVMPGSIIYDKKSGTPYVVPGTGNRKKYRGWRWAQNLDNKGKWGKWAKGGAAAGMTLAGAGLGYGADKFFGGNGGVGATLGTITGAGIGIWGMTGFAGAGALLTNPVGWGVLAAAAVVGVTAAIVASAKAAREAKRAVQEWGDGLKMLHSSAIDLSLDNGVMFANMRVFNSELDNQRAKIQAGIDTLNEYWRLQNLGEDKPDNDASVVSAPNGDKLNHWMDIADDNTGKFSKLWPYLQKIGATAVKSGGKTHYMINGVEFAHSSWGANFNGEESSAIVSILQGANASPYKMQSAFLHALQNAKGAEFIDDAIKDVRKTWLPATDKAYNDASVDTKRNWSEQSFLKDKWYQLTWKTQVDQTEQMYAPLKKVMLDYSKGASISAEAMQDALYKSGISILFDKSQFGLIGSPQWYQSIKNLQQHPERFKGLHGEAISKTAAYGEVNRAFGELVKFYGNFNNVWHPMFGDILNRSIWNNALPKKETLVSGGFTPGVKVGAKAKANGISYTWKELTGNGYFGKYGWVSDKGNVFVPDSSMGELQLYNSKGELMSETEQYLRGITFNSAWNTQYPVDNALQSIGSLSVNAASSLMSKLSGFGQPNQPGPWATGYVMPDSKWQVPPLTPNVSQTGFAYNDASTGINQPNVTLSAENIAQGNQYLADNLVGSQNITLNYYEQAPSDAEGLAYVLKNASQLSMGKLFGISV